ncbi:piggyBac transposable element-derived protein 4-like isoform X2 [Engraulis encrasicolus]
MPFIATPGPQNAAAELDGDQPASFLELFLTDDLLQYIVDQTNLYAVQYLRAHPDGQPHSRVNAWEPMSVTELKAFFGLCFLTSYVKKPSLELYWSLDEVDATPYFNKTMSRNRFQMIWRFLHFNDNNIVNNSDVMQDATNEMCEVRPVFDYVIGRFKEMFQPGQNICIDLGTMQWRGRLAFRAHNPQAPVQQHGIKSYVLRDSATGYCFNMIPYIGEAVYVPDMVFALLDRLAGHGYTLYMDNVDISVALCERLLESRTNVCATLTKHGGEPKAVREVTKTSLKVGEKVAQHNERVMVVAWHDINQLVRMVTTCHQDEMKRPAVRQKKGRKRDKVGRLKPECVIAFNTHMNSVSKLDHDVAYFPVVRRSLSWCKKFVAYLNQLCLFNAHVLYQARHPGKCKTLLEFTQRVVKSWTSRRRVTVETQQDDMAAARVEQVLNEAAPVELEEEVRQGRRNPRAPFSDPESRLDGDLRRHKLENLPPTNNRAKPGRRCRVCFRKGLRRETKFWCVGCSVPLHPGDCFTDYHTKQNYV